MQNKMMSHAFVPLSQASDTEATIRTQIFPLVDTGPTRGGQVTMQALLEHEDGRYLWLIGYETTGGTWHESKIVPAQDKLKSLGVIYATRSLLLLSSLTRETAGKADPGGKFPLGQSGATVRIYEITPIHHTQSDTFEQAVIEQVLPAVSLHPPNRIGHSTDSQILVKEERDPALGEDGNRYLWMISHSVYELFEERDTFPADIQDALIRLETVGQICGFGDYQLVFAANLSESQ